MAGSLRLGLLGHPVAHSLSPQMHGAWIAAAGLEATYQTYPLAPESSGEVVLATLEALGLHGANLTVPFKERVVDHLVSIEPLAARIGAVNTVVRVEGGFRGLNTDAPGFVRSVEGIGQSIAGATVVVLGAGGAARAVAVGAADAGAERVFLLNRSVERAARVAHQLTSGVAGATRFESGPFDAFEALAPQSQLLVNAVSGAGLPAIRSLETSGVRPDALWVDLNYWDRDPPHFRALTARGVRVQAGDAMLVEQGALAFRAFTGIAADPAVGMAALGSGVRP